MRIQDVLRLVVGLVFLATLPTVSAQKTGSACVIDGDCSGTKCCRADNTCSKKNMGVVGTGKKATDACECISGVYIDSTKRCGCSEDSHCSRNKCCKTDGTCSSRDKDSILPGRLANDACECVSHAFYEPTAKCMCSDEEQHCEGNTCCKANMQCSTRDQGSVFGGSRAGDACECVSGLYDASTKKCLCKENSDCSGNKCCTEDGTCSKRSMQSLQAGKRPDDACECVSGLIAESTGRCACSEDEHCTDDNCCRASGVCSSRDRGSTLPGKAAKDECECSTPIYDADTKRCGCTEDSHCSAKPKKSTCDLTDNVCVEINAACVNDEDCADGNCCRASGVCSTRARGSTLPGELAEDECDCSKNIYDTDTKRCGCSDVAHCSAKPDKKFCSFSQNVCVRAVGDPHMTGFAGQKYDFTGIDDSWYALISEPPRLQLNMRVTVPVPSQPKTTYITGFSLLTTDEDGRDHSIVVKVKEPHNLETACPVGVSPCLADGSLTVTLDGEEALAGPGVVSLAPGVEITAVNTPGECRSFGFKAYWAKKKQENAAYWAKKEKENAQDSRKLGATLSMGEWLLEDSTATNMADCAEYVARSAAVAGGLFAHQSEHSSFRIVTPTAEIRLSHGKRNDFATPDPTDTIDLPDHVTWQMNIVMDHIDVSDNAKGILGETKVPTRDAEGNAIMHGLRCIRGAPEDYAVEGPLGRTFTMDSSGTVSKHAAAGTFQ